MRAGSPETQTQPLEGMPYSPCWDLPPAAWAPGAPELRGNKGQTKANQALLGSFQEFDSFFISALLHKQQGQLQQGIWDQVVVIFNLLFTAGQRKTWSTGSVLEMCFRPLLPSLPLNWGPQPIPPCGVSSSDFQCGKVPITCPWKDLGLDLAFQSSAPPP